MSIKQYIQNIGEWLKGMFSRTALTEVAKIPSAQSVVMDGHIKEWADTYEGNPSWIEGGEMTLNLAALVSSRVANLVTNEFKSEISSKPMNDIYQELIKNIRVQIEYGLAKGGLIIKPYISDKQCFFEFVQADNFIVTKFSPVGEIYGVVFISRTKRGDEYYTKFEFHDFDKKKADYTVENIAFKSKSISEIGHPTSLANVSEWADLKPNITFPNVKFPLFGYFKPALANNIDPQSFLGVSIFSRAMPLLKEADKQYNRFIRENERSEKTIFVSRHLLQTDERDHEKMFLPKNQQNMFVGLKNSNPDEYREYNPEIRNVEFLRALDQFKKDIEDTIGLARGTISAVEKHERTATELNVTKQVTYSTVVDNQKALQTALEEFARALSYYMTITDYSVSFGFDDSIVNDRDKQFQEWNILESKEMASKAEFRMWYFGEDEDTARKKILEIQNESMEIDGEEG